MKPGWRRWRFEDIAASINQRVDDPTKAGVDYYVGLEHLDSDSMKIRRWGSPEDVSATKLLFEPGDVIFGRRRAYQRKLGVAEFRGIASAHSLVLRAKPNVALPEFLPFFMQSDLFMERAQRISVGSLSPTINWRTLAKEEFALPPLDEQRRLTSILVTTWSSVDAYRNLLHAAKTPHQAFVDSFLAEGAQQRFFGKKAHPLLEGWTYRRLEDLCCEMVDCLHRTPIYSSDGYPAIRTADVEPGFLQWEGANRVSAEEFAIQTKRLKPESGDVLFSREGERMGMAAQIPEGVEVCISQRMMHLRAKADFPANLLMQTSPSPPLQTPPTA